MDYTLLVAGLKGALFLEVLPKLIWPKEVFYYKVPGEDETAYQRLLDVVGPRSKEVSPKNFQLPANETLILTIGWQYLLSDYKNIVILHDSLLPRFRGFSPTVSALIKGESGLGVTALLADENMDSGPILAQHSVLIESPITIERAFEYLSECYVKCTSQVLSYGPDYKSKGVDQEPSKASYSIWRDDEDYEINWNLSAKEIVRFISAVGYPYMGARTYLGQRGLVVQKAEELEDVNFELRQPGKLWRIYDSSSADVICGSGVVRIWAEWIDGEISEVFSKLRIRLGSKVT